MSQYSKIIFQNESKKQRECKGNNRVGEFAKQYFSCFGFLKKSALRFLHHCKYLVLYYPENVQNISAYTTENAQ